jgi:tRNA(fMet)-specific endonuclease VapC
MAGMCNCNMILLDTNIVIDYLNGKEPVASKVIDRIGSIAISTIVVAELDYGAKASANSSKNLQKLNRFLDLVRIIPFDLASARMLGTVKSALRKIGKPTGEVDAMIAAVALTHRAELITGNTKHFQHIAGIRLANWQRPDTG